MPVLGASSGSSLSVTTQTANYAASPNDEVQANALNGAFSVTLPAPSAGAVVTVRKTDYSPNGVTVLPHASETINNQSTSTVDFVYDSRTYVADGTNWTARSDLNKRFDPRLCLFNVKPSNTKNFRAALARSRQAGGALRVRSVGDSLEASAYSAGTVPNDTIQARTRRLLDGGQFGTCVEGLVYARFTETGGIGADPRWTLGTGWSLTNNLSSSAAGLFQALYAATGTGKLSFGPVTCDRFTVYWFGYSSTGTFSLDIDGGTATTVASKNNGAGIAGFTLSSTTITAGSTGAHTLNITPPTNGTDYAAIVGVEFHTGALTAQTGARFDVAATSGKRWNDINQDNAAGQTAPVLWDIATPDLAIIRLGTNDSAFGNSLPSLYSTMQTVIGRAQAKNTDVVIEMPPPQGTGWTNAAGWPVYIDTIYKAAESMDVVVADGYRHFLSNWTTVNAAPLSLMNDTAHPNDKGNWELAAWRAQWLKSLAS